jgi:HEAT repeat protein
MLLDDAGDDSYAATRDGTQGSATPARNTGGIGLLLDGAGHDRFTETTRDEHIAVKDVVGACIDEPTPTEKPSDNPMNAAISKEDAAKKVEAEGKKDGAWDLDKLWAMVISWEVGDNTVIMPIARERFFALGRPALDRAFANFDDKHGLAIRGVEFTLREFAKTDRAGVVARLIEKTRDPDKLVRKNAVLLVMNLQVTEALPRLTEMLTTDPDTTGGVLAALAAMKTAPPEVVAMLKHSRESVGVQAAVCLAAAAAESKEQPDLSPLIAALGPDYPFPVRLAAQERLASLGSHACTALACWDDLPTPMAQRAALRALGGTKDPRAAWAIERAFASKDPMVRLSATLAADDLLKSLDAKASQWLAAAVARARAAETDPLVKRLAGGPGK